MIWKLLKLYYLQKDNPKLFSIYRPISVLLCFSKIIERIVHERCYTFLTKNNVLYKRQYGFCNKHSTYMAVLDFINDANKAIDNNLYTAGSFMNLSKAFDPIDHKILWDKSYHHGFRGVFRARSKICKKGKKGGRDPKGGGAGGWYNPKIAQKQPKIGWICMIYLSKGGGTVPIRTIRGSAPGFTCMVSKYLSKQKTNGFI